MVVRFIVFLTLSTLMYRGTDISKCFSESLGIRDNESRLYVVSTCSYTIILSFCRNHSTDFNNSLSLKHTCKAVVCPCVLIKAFAVCFHQGLCCLSMHCTSMHSEESDLNVPLCRRQIWSFAVRTCLENNTFSFTCFKFNTSHFWFTRIYCFA